MGEGAKPLFSFWDNQKLNYIAARKQIYIPLYAKYVQQTFAYEHLAELYNFYDGEIALADFDGYRHRDLGMSLIDVINNPSRSMGHAFVLSMCLEGTHRFRRSL